MTVFKIDKDVPMPASTLRQGHNIQLLRTMEPGNSVFFGEAVIAKAVRFYRVAKKLGVTIAIRKEGNGMRMWKLSAGVNPSAAKQVASAAVARAASHVRTKTKARTKAKARSRVTA